MCRHQQHTALYLERSRHHGRWIVSDDEVMERFEWNDEGESGRPFDVVVDGRIMSWEDLGMALEAYEGWNFRLVIEDHSAEARSDAEVIELRSRLASDPER